MSNAKLILTGVVWNSIQLIVSRVFGFIIKLVLARILFPEDYGLVGMAAVFTTFINVFNDLGMGAALVQRKKKDLTEKHYYTAFWTGFIWSIFLYLMFAFGINRVAAWFYDEPFLIDLIPVLSLGILASPINLVHRAQLNKRMDFKKIAFITNSANIFSGVLALILAFSGAGIWALVFNSVSSIIIAMPLYFKATKWWPKVIWDKKCFQDIFGFGIYTTFTGILNKIISQIDYLMVGKFVGASALGIYSFAFIITDTLRGQLAGIITRVMFPFYSKIQDDNIKLKEYFLKVLKYNALLVYPPMFTFMIFAQFLIPLVFGDKWAESTIIIQILSASVVIHMFVNSHTSLLRASGHQKLELQLQIFKSVVLFVPVITIATLNYGVNGTAIGYFIANTIGVGISIIVLKKIFNISLLEILDALSKPIMICIIPSLISLFLIFLLHWYIVLLIFLSLMSAIGYYFCREDFVQVFNLIKKK